MSWLRGQVSDCFASVSAHLTRYAAVIDQLHRRARLHESMNGLLQQFFVVATNCRLFG